MGVKVAVVGAGSTYTPELVEGFVAHGDRLPVDELAVDWRAESWPGRSGPAA
jgi:6-phospho-beta-glucosidase